MKQPVDRIDEDSVELQTYTANRKRNMKEMQERQF
jgi:hypothetical protein